MRSSFRLASIAVAVAIVSAAPSVASAQLAPIHFAVGAGAAIPIGSSSDNINTGYTVYGAADLGIIASPIGFRGELTYSKWGAKGLSGTGISADASDLGVNANVVLWTTPSSALSPGIYMTAGPSFSHATGSVRSGSTTVSESENHFGFNIGAGVDFPLGTLALRLDARYKQISTDGESFKTIPITVGIRF